MDGTRTIAKIPKVLPALVQKWARRLHDRGDVSRADLVQTARCCEKTIKSWAQLSHEDRRILAQAVTATEAFASNNYIRHSQKLLDNEKYEMDIVLKRLENAEISLNAIRYNIPW